MKTSLSVLRKVTLWSRAQKEDFKCNWAFENCTFHIEVLPFFCFPKKWSLRLTWLYSSSRRSFYAKSSRPNWSFSLKIQLGSWVTKTCMSLTALFSFQTTWFTYIEAFSHTCATFWSTLVGNSHVGIHGAAAKGKSIKSNAKSRVSNIFQKSKETCNASFFRLNRV